MAGTTGTSAMAAQVKPSYPKPKAKRKPRPWSSQNKKKR